MLKNAKIYFLQTCERLGVSRAVLNSRWRRNHLLILCYHGISLEDEHEWNGSLYMTRELFRHRMQTLADYECNVLALGEAVRRLYAGDLPDRSVVLTFDDGAYDFYKVGWPVVREFGYPVTVYLTTYYSDFNRPVFDVMCSYVLWKGRNCDRLDWPGVFSGPLDETGRDAAVRGMKAFALSQRLSGRQKDDLLGELSARLGVDYELLCRKHILHIMTPEEVRELASEGVDFQLHTHRHRVWRRREKLYSELDDNRARITAASGVEPKHFCYTGGFYLPEFESYLEQYGILSATTCKPGLCDEWSNRMFLPRLVDTSGLTGAEFRGWVSGLSQILPQRPYVMSEGQLAEEAT